VKLTLLDSKGARILPAYYTDNYVSLLPASPAKCRLRRLQALSPEPPALACVVGMSTDEQFSHLDLRNPAKHG
jgi:hypothetical protein